MDTVQSPLGTSRRIPQLDGLRGAAIAMVVVYHYAIGVAGVSAKLPAVLAAPINLGWSGVDLFFVLSGFLIGGILLDARGSVNYFRVFYRRRVCRIFPMYFTSLAAFLFAAHFVRSSEIQHVFQPTIPWQACVAFVQNFWMAVRNSGGGIALNPTWSLAVEEQFYLTLPAIIFLVKPRKLIWFLSGGIVLAPLIRLAIFLANPRLLFAIVDLLPCRMDSLLIGVATAYFLRRPGAWEFLRSHRRHLWTVIEVLTCVCATFLYSPSTFSPAMMLVGFDCLGLLYAAILVVSLVDESVAKLLSLKWLVELGTVSYCVYLIHELVFAIAYLLLRGRTNSWAITALLSATLTVIIAKLSWVYFEKPFVTLGHQEHYEQIPQPRTSDSRVSQIG